MPDPLTELERGREAYARGAWREAYEALARADGLDPMGPDDLWRLAMSAALLGRDLELLSALERAHHAHLDAGAPEGAARCAFWLGLRLAYTGEMGPAAGWFGRAGRLLERDGLDCVERGYLLVPRALEQLSSGAREAAYATAGQAVRSGERFDDPDLVALGLHLQGRALLDQERIDEGLALLDEAMVAVAAGELSPLVTGLVYCSVIGACRRVFALRRAHEWTAALSEWCERQPELVAFTGECLVFRAEILQLRGAWREAIEEARRARERYPEGAERRAAAAALYRQGEVHRLLGAFEEAEEAYRNASRWGFEPQPGLALLRLAQGRRSAAVASIRRAPASRVRRDHAGGRRRREGAARVRGARAARRAGRGGKPPDGRRPGPGRGGPGRGRPRGRTPPAPEGVAGVAGAGGALRGRPRPRAARVGLAAHSATRTRPPWSSRPPATTSARWGRPPTWPGRRR